MVSSLKSLGIHDIVTAAGSARGPGKRAQLGNQLARLEHQQALLEKQLAVWLLQKEKTERRLSVLRNQIAGIREDLDPGRGPAGPNRRSPAPAAAEPGERFRHLTVEY